MASTEQWIDIARRCEEAKAADKSIDGAILRGLGWTVSPRFVSKLSWVKDDNIIRADESRLTRSIDAITALIERELPGWIWRIYSAVPETEISQQLPPQAAMTELHANHEPFYGQVLVTCAATEPLAFCAAFCRAMAAKEGEK